MKRFPNSPWLTLSLISILILSSCSAAPSATPTAVVGTPAATMAANAGMVKGAIYVQLNGKFVPLKNTDLFLGNILISSSGTTGVAGLDQGTAPRSSTDDQGNFVFQNVPAGKYGLILYLVTHAYLLNEPDKDVSMIITVTASKVTDLGQLQYRNFPITPPS